LTTSGGYDQHRVLAARRIFPQGQAVKCAVWDRLAKELVGKNSLGEGLVSSHDLVLLREDLVLVENFFTALFAPLIARPSSPVRFRMVLAVAAHWRLRAGDFTA
jgi:hypothetical protein